MSKLATALLSCATATALGVTVLPAQATSLRTFVSGTGASANTSLDCPRAAPCRNFAEAYGVTDANGEITVLDPGSYGALTISKNISIVNDGVGEAGILVSGGFTGIIADTAGIAITLRGITIKGIGFGGGNGIVVNAAAALNVENCTIRNLDGTNVGNAIVVQPSSGTATLTVTNTTITDNATDGILVQPSGSGSVNGSLRGVGLHSNGFAGLMLSGANTTGAVHFAVTDSAATNNGAPNNGVGFVALTGAGVTELHLERSVAANNPGSGVVAFGPGAIVHIGDSTVVANAVGWQAQFNGVIDTYGDNVVVDNGSNPGPATLVFKN